MFRFNFKGQPAQLTWHAQELVTASLEHIHGKELLTRGVITASQTPIPVGELFDYITQDKTLLLNMTCQQIDDLLINKRFFPAVSGTIWINISGKLISDDELFHMFWQQTLEKIHAEDKQKLVLEICEDSIDDTVIIERIAYLQARGFQVAMDDFGSGHSNLIRLSQTNFDYIKLDLQLIKHVPEDLWASSLYREIIELCSSKGALIVAEGVETQAQSDFVRWAGVDIIQGFLYSRPEAI